METRIPKVIHYAWFGRGTLNSVAKKCINSWKTMLPDYTIIEWNEDNFPFEKYPYALEAYQEKKYAYVSDVVRLYVLYEYGGVYMDTDVEVIKDITSFLQYDGFSGFQSEKEIPTGIMAAEKGNGWVLDQLNYYKDKHFNLEDVNIKKITNVDIITKISLEKHGLVLNNKEQELKYGMKMYPLDYFCAKSASTGIIKITDNTYTIHHFVGSWAPEKSRRNKKIYMFLVRIFGEKISKLIIKIIKKSK